MSFKRYLNEENLMRRTANGTTSCYFFHFHVAYFSLIIPKKKNVKRNL